MLFRFKTFEYELKNETPKQIVFDELNFWKNWQDLCRVRTDSIKLSFKLGVVRSKITEVIYRLGTRLNLSS